MYPESCSATSERLSFGCLRSRSGVTFRAFRFRISAGDGMNSTARHLNDKTALITGASGGIGYELAKLFAGDHCNLVLVARNAERLSQIAGELAGQFGIKVKTVALDLGALPAPKFLFDDLQREGISVEILVNNAGFGVFGEFAQMPEEEILGQLQLNITALTELCRLFLPPMVARCRGKIMNVASTAAFQPGPLMAVYYASKAYVLSFSEAIANELKGTGVTVTALCPGPTESEFQKRAHIENTRLIKSKLMGRMTSEQ